MFISIKIVCFKNKASTAKFIISFVDLFKSKVKIIPAVKNFPPMT